jgi:TonB family protein
MDIPRPHIVSFGSNDELRRFYPAEADKAGIEGTVIMRATLDETGRLTDARVVSESPPDMGFGAAASRLVQTFTYANPTGHPAEFAFKVKFDPKEPASAGDPEKS